MPVLLITEESDPAQVAELELTGGLEPCGIGVHTASDGTVYAAQLFYGA